MAYESQVFLLYYKYHVKFKSINTLLYRFTYISIGWPGKVHDARVLRNSSLYNNIEANIVNL